MAVASMLCRHSAAKLLGATFDPTQGCVLVTVQGDGVTAYNLEQRQLASYPLGSRVNVEFAAASAQLSSAGADKAIVASIVHDQAAGTYTLCHHASGAPARAIADAPARVLLPGPAHSCHILHRTTPTAEPTHPATPTTAVVLSDGRVGVSACSPEPGGTALTMLPSASPTAAAPRHLLAASLHETLVVASQASAGSPVTLRVLQLSRADAAGLAQVKAASLPCPGGPGAGAAHASPTGLTLSSGYALLQWSNGHATAVHGLQGGASAPLRPVVFPLAEAVGANGASSSAPAIPAPASGAASGRKRKTGAAAAGAADGNSPASRPRVLCAAVDERQFLLLDLQSSAAQSHVCYSLHDAQFGVPLSSGSVEVDAPLLSLEAADCSVVAAGPEAAVVRLGGGVHVLHVQSQPVSLLSLVARLSVSASAATSAAAGAAKQQQQGAACGRGVAAALAELPAPVSLDPALLTGSVAGGGAAASAAAAAASDDMADVVLQPVPEASVSRLDDICNSLVAALSAVRPHGTPPPQALLDSAVSYILGRRQHAMPVPPQLPSLAARGLAAARQWGQLASLLASLPAGGLCGCSEVLVAVAAAAQYGLLPRLSTCLDEVEPGALVAALQLLLAPTTRLNQAARQQHYAALRASAEARVAEAEALMAAAAPQQRGGRGGGGGGGRGPAADPASALALAQCAAAVVDGFSHREVLLHPLLAVPVDGPAVQVALRRLSGPAADALLGYLAKWAAKYAGGAIGEAAAGVVLPQELLFPYYHQVLEWTRMTIDAHLARLLMSRTPLPALESLEAALGGAVEGARRLMLLRGALEHVHAAAPLPAAHIAVATQYTAEVLDLRVR